jgi:hypothetical protein
MEKDSLKEECAERECEIHDQGATRLDSGITMPGSTYPLMLPGSLTSV